MTPLPQSATVVLPPNMPHERMEAFRTFVANHLRAGLAKGKSEAQVMAQLTADQTTIKAVLKDAAFVETMAQAYADKLAELEGKSNLAEARREIVSIVKNRIADCQGFVWLLSQQDFLGAARAEAAQPAPQPKPYQLSAAKITEEVNNILYKHDGSSQPAVHVAMSARGHHTGHMALANMFAPKTGPLHDAMIAALARVAPQASGEQIAHLAETWLKQRHDPAHEIAKALVPGGAIYTRAMAQSEALQNQRLGLADPALQASVAIAKAQASAAATDPLTTTTQPRTALGTAVERIDPAMVAQA